MIYGSVCSGIEAATVAWHPLGWRPAFFSEIDKFPRSVLQHHYPSVPLHGDFTTIGATDYEPIDLFVGGTPCQSFSIAGLRKGFADERGSLTLEFVRLAERLRPRWVVWENVPGVLSMDRGRAFGSFLRGLAELGYGFAYRVLDAQYFGVPQRRRRVFVVGYLGDWRGPAAVLFECESLRRDLTPGREKGKEIAGDAAIGLDEECNATVDGFGCLNAGGMGRQDYETETLITHSLRGEGFDASEDGTGRGIPLVVDTLTSNGDAHSGFRDEKGLVAIAFAQNQLGEVRTSDIIGTLNQNSNASGRNTPMISSAMSVRRLLPVECERLQGFPDYYTMISPKTADGLRYKALGNSMAVPVMGWLGERIQMVDGLIKTNKEV